MRKAPKEREGLMRKHTSKILALGLVATLAVGALAGCGGGSASSAASPGGSSANGAQAAAAGQGDLLTFGCQNYGGGSVDPAQETNSAWNAMRYGITECLFKFDDTMEVEGWLAKDDYTVSDDHKTWTFNIRDDVKFSDGTQMTPSAVAASFERLFKDGASGSSTPEKFLDPNAKITADDAAGTLTIETEEAYPDLRKNLAYPTMAIVNVDATTDYTNGVIGTGPYVIDTYTADVGYTMKANENYYESVPFKQVDIKYLGDATAKHNALTAGDVTLTENISTAADLNTLKGDANYTVNVANGVRCGFSYVNFDGVLKNDALRQAVMMAIDGQTVCDVTVGGLYTYGYSVLPSNLEYNYDKLTYKYKFDKDAAIKLLDDNNIVDTDGDGIRELDGENIKLEWITYENRSLADMAQAGQQQLAEVGIDVNIAVTDSENEWNKMVAGEYDLCSSNWTTVGTGDPTEYLANWNGGNAANYCNYKNDKFDEAYSELLTEFDDSKRIELITTMQQCLLDDAAVLVHGYYNSSMIFANSAVSNAPIHTADYYWLTTEVKPAA